MQWIKIMYKQFLREPLWFKVLIPLTLLASILFSSSFFSNHVYYQSIAKLAAAIFFCSYGIKMRRNRQISVIFFAITVLCIFLAWHYLQLA
jgi:hypothetical protein